MLAVADDAQIVEIQGAGLAALECPCDIASDAVKRILPVGCFFRFRLILCLPLNEFYHFDFLIFTHHSCLLSNARWLELWTNAPDVPRSLDCPFDVQIAASDATRQLIGKIDLARIGEEQIMHFFDPQGSRRDLQ